MAEILIMGELLVEIMRTKVDVTLYENEVFKGPFPSGAPGIFIDVAARLGCQTAIISGVGQDEFGQCIIDRLISDGVDCHCVIESKERATGVAFVTYFTDGSRKFIYHMGNTPAVEAKAPQVGVFSNVKYMHIMGCSLMANEDFAQEILKTMRMLVLQGTKISFDPNIRKELLVDSSIDNVIAEVIENTSVFMPGVEELLLTMKSQTIEGAIEKCFENDKMEIVALKKGSQGSVIYTREEVVNVSAYEVEQLDATGAGDCFDGAFVAGLVQGKEIVQAAQMAAAAGALNAAAFGPMEGDISMETINKMVGS